MKQESERLRKFDMPNQVSIDSLGDLKSGQNVLDIGAGENTKLGEYIRHQGAHYIAFDVRKDALHEQIKAGSAAVQGDALSLPFAYESMNYVHARFVLSHFEKAKRQAIMKESFGKLAKEPRGQLTIVEYDWTVMHGSPLMNRWRDFTLKHFTVFSPSYGSEVTDEVKETLGKEAVINERRVTPEKQFDYRPALGLREITLKSLEIQHADKSVIDEAVEIFAELKKESDMPEPPGFYMPEFVVVTAIPKLA